MTTNTHLTGLLQLAVPMHVWQLQKLTPEEVASVAKDAAPLIAFKGDILLYGGGRKGEAAEVFNATARGIAALSLLPGGVTLFGIHWENHYLTTSEGSSR